MSNEEPPKNNSEETIDVEIIDRRLEKDPGESEESYAERKAKFEKQNGNSEQQRETKLALVRQGLNGPKTPPKIAPAKKPPESKLATFGTSIKHVGLQAAPAGIVVFLASGVKWLWNEMLHGKGGGGGKSHGGGGGGGGHSSKSGH